MKLYDSRGAPSPRRVRIYLAEKHIEVERVMVDLRSGEHLEAAFLAINPRGAVPALELDDGEVVCESAAICRYFEALHPTPALFGVTPVEIARIESWTRRIESDGYAAAVYVLRNTVDAFRDRPAAGKWPAMPQIPELGARGVIMWDVFVETLEAQLSAGHAAGRTWIATDTYSFADITALVTIDFAARCKLAIPEEARALRRWHAAASARPSAQA